MCLGPKAAFSTAKYVEYAELAVVQNYRQKKKDPRKNSTSNSRKCIISCRIDVSCVLYRMLSLQRISLRILNRENKPVSLYVVLRHVGRACFAPVIVLDWCASVFVGVCVCACLCVPISLCLCVSLSVSPYLPLSLYISL